MVTSSVRPPLDYYLGLRYPVLVHVAEEGGYVAEIPDLPGCVTQAETPVEIFEMIEDARRLWIEATYEDGREIPLPRSEADYSGKFIVRMPASLHRRLAETADREGVSLNLYVVTMLAAGPSIGALAPIEARVHLVEETLGRIEQSLAKALEKLPAKIATPASGAYRATSRGDIPGRVAYAVTARGTAGRKAMHVQGLFGGTQAGLSAVRRPGQAVRYSTGRRPGEPSQPTDSPK